MKQTLPFTYEQIKNWVDQYSTPFYIYDKQEITKRIKDLQAAFSWNKGFKEMFAVKAAPTPAILRLLASLGCGTDCASIQEIELSKRCGITGKDMVLTSNQTRPDEYLYAYKAGAIINLDDITQISNMESSCGIPDTVFCRYNPGKFNFDNTFIGDQKNSKFGMTKSQLFEAFEILKNKGVKHFGLHSMSASCCLDENYYPALASELFKIATELKDKLDITCEFIDLSGGIGIPYRPEESEVDIFAIGANVKKVYDEILGPYNMEPAIFTELGRYITGPCGYLITSVVGHKHIYKEYVGVDASACDLMRPAMYGAYHNIQVMTKDGCQPAETAVVDVVGPLCENNDKFAVDRLLPLTEIGDILIIEDCGAHSRSMGYNYNSRLRCAEFMLNDGNLSMIRRAETIDDYFATFDVDTEFNKSGV